MTNRSLFIRSKKKKNTTLALVYTKLTGSACKAYYVDVVVRTEGGESAPIKMVVDTGAMISTIPESVITDKSLSPFLLGRPVILRDFEGKARRARTYKVDLLILKDGIVWFASRPKHGVTSRRENINPVAEAVGLLGLDVLCDFVTYFDTAGAHMTKKEDRE